MAIALTLTLIIAALTICKARGVSGSAIEKTFESALGPVCSVILITGAGGMFGGVLRTSGIGNALEVAEAVHAESTQARAAARQRVLDYNEDDVLATAHLRAWLRGQ